MKKFQLSILPGAQLAIWLTLAKLSKHFVLYGGTAIALRLAHRESVDFDFFTNKDFSSDELMREMPFLANSRRLQESRNTLTVLMQVTGFDIPVKLSFFGGLQLGQINPPESADNGVLVASLMDLFGMKCAVISQRAEAKDYIDIYTIINNSTMTLEDGLGAAKAIYGRQYNAILTLKALSCFQDGNIMTLPDKIKHSLSSMVKECNLSNIPEILPMGIIGKTTNGIRHDHNE
ncbi:MAG: nucleotidyl transferase AbiEii/AbiGii toxin family protein [Desulfosarcina sp.]|nr:nucleotidyl transferase AbiEii/AbiGii toxin family protein [Desulfobacterales bacterium]